MYGWMNEKKNCKIIGKIRVFRILIEDKICNDYWR